MIVGKNNQYYCSESNCILSKDRASLIVGCNNSIIPDGITRIDKAAFDGCTGLISLKIPDSVTEIGELAFYECTGLASIEIPDRVTVIGRLAFDGCTGLTSIKIPDSVTEIGEGVFSGCNGLTSIVIPDSVTEIGDSAFAYNTGLTSLEIPGSITEIGYDAFYGCPNLKDVFIDAKQSSTIEFLLETIPQRKRITLHVPVESEYADLHGEATKGFKAVVAEKWK